MSNILGNNLKVTIFGQSHGEAIGCVIDGLCAGIKIDEEFINECLSKRRPNGIGETKRVELDNYKIISGSRMEKEKHEKSKTDFNRRGKPRNDLRERRRKAL